ncbi:FeoA domain-containing protein [Lancefieldella rimae]
MGLTEGCSIEMVQNAKRRPLLVFERDSVVAIDRADCKNIEVEVLS